MSEYVFVGTHSYVGTIELSRFGQRVELPDGVARTAIAGGCALLPAEEFETIGFTAEEVERHPYPGDWESAPAELIAKRCAAHAAVARIREEIQRGRV
jgi:hypothetical protein